MPRRQLPMASGMPLRAVSHSSTTPPSSLCHPSTHILVIYIAKTKVLFTTNTLPAASHSSKIAVLWACVAGSRLAVYGVMHVGANCSSGVSAFCCWIFPAVLLLDISCCFVPLEIWVGCIKVSWFLRVPNWLRHQDCEWYYQTFLILWWYLVPT